MTRTMKRRFVHISTGAVVCVCVAASTVAIAVFRDRRATDAAAPDPLLDSLASVNPSDPTAISNLLEFSIDSFRKDDAPVGILRDDKDVDASVPWAPGMKHPVRPDDPDLPGSGTNTLRSILGQSEAWHVYNSVCGMYTGSPETLPYERTDDATILHFPQDWEVRIDNATGAILEPPGLPPLSVEEMSDLTWAELSRDGGVERWMQTIATASAYGGKICRLDGFRLDEIRFVGDKAFVGWRILKDPPSTDGFIRLTFWIDRRTKRIVHSGTEIHEDR